MSRRSLFLRLASRLEGPQTLGRGRRFWIGAAIVLVVEPPAEPQVASDAVSADLTLQQPQLANNG